MGSGKLKRSEENRGRLQAKARPEGNGGGKLNGSGGRPRGARPRQETGTGSREQGDTVNIVRSHN